MDDTRRMQRRLDGSDRDKLDQYLTGVVTWRSGFSKPSDSAERGSRDANTRRHSVSQADYVELMYDMMLLAFKTDSTRV